MSKYGMTRVSLVGDKTIIVAGPVPEHIAEKAVSQEPAGNGPGAVTRPDKKTSKPPKFVAPAKPAQPAPAVKKEK